MLALPLAFGLAACTGSEPSVSADSGMNAHVDTGMTAAPAETRYEDLLAEAVAATKKVEAAKKAQSEAKAARLAKLERAWAAVSKIMGTTALDKGRRVIAVQRFLSDYPSENPHLKAAHVGLVALKRGKEPDGSGGAATGALNWIYSRPAKLEMMRTEVTVAQYKGCVDAGKCKRGFKVKSDYRFCNLGYSSRIRHPMNCVNWNGADAFCRWAGGRLPTEHEWFAEASNSKSREYPWGSQKATCARAIMEDGQAKGSAGSETHGCGEDRTWPVCSRRKGDSVSGMCDMSGNVWEWTSSENASERVRRGGSWISSNQDDLRTSGRLLSDPSRTEHFIGFRCVRPASPPR